MLIEFVEISYNTSNIFIKGVYKCSYTCASLCILFAKSIFENNMFFE